MNGRSEKTRQARLIPETVLILGTVLIGFCELSGYLKPSLRLEKVTIPGTGLILKTVLILETVLFLVNVLILETVLILEIVLIPKTILNSTNVLILETGLPLGTVYGKLLPCN